MANKHIIYDMDIDEVIYQSITIDELQINEEYRRVPGDIAYWNSRAAKAMKAMMAGKFNLERVDARLKIEHRERLNKTRDKVTESMVDSVVLLDEEYAEARMAAIDAEAEYAHVRGIAQAVVARKDVLQSLGANLRIEMQSDPIIRDQINYSRKKVISD